jgi:membrane-associated protease RseP (regulator of RpoE activity)
MRYAPFFGTGLCLGRWITLASLFVLIGSSAAEVQEPNPRSAPKETLRYQVPYRLTDSQHVLVRVKLNGKGPFHFILDTGAPAVFLTKNVAKKVGVKTDAQGWAIFDTFEIEGGVRLTQVKGRIEDLVQLDGMNTLGLAGVELHGVIGYNVLARFRIEYDFTVDKLGFEFLPNFEPPDPERLRAEGPDDIQMMGPFIKMIAALTGIKANFATAPRGFLGIEVAHTDGKVVIQRVYPGTAAAKAGLQPGDVIAAVRAQSIDAPADLHRALRRAGVGSAQVLTIERQGKRQEVRLELGRGL